MKKTLDFLKTEIGRLIIQAVQKMADAAKAVAEYLIFAKKEKIRKETAEKEKNRIESIKKACEKGTLDDLIDAVSKRICVFPAVLFFVPAGCVSVNVQTQDPNEGRYQDRESLMAAVKDVKIDKKHPVWLLKAETLQNLLTTSWKNEK